MRYGESRGEYYESSEHQNVHHGYFSGWSLFEGMPGTLSEARRPGVRAVVRGRTVTLDSACLGSAADSAPLAGAAELVSSGTGGADPAPRDKPCAFHARHCHRGPSREHLCATIGRLGKCVAGADNSPFWCRLLVFVVIDLRGLPGLLGGLLYAAVRLLRRCARRLWCAAAAHSGTCRRRALWPPLDRQC